MKFKIDYDMLKEIKHSKKGISAAEYFFRDEKRFFGISAQKYIYLIEGIINKNAALIVVNLVAIGLIYKLSSIRSKKNMDRDKNEAYLKLQDLATSLYKLEVNTTAELLQESEMLESHLKFRFVDNKPMIIEKTYIDVPLSNGYKETILQEHRFGSKEWEISVEEPEKNVSYKLARGRV